MRQSAHGFTIVELLIVIVAISILAAITIVSYAGVTRQAKESSLKADLSSGIRQLQITYSKNNAYPTTADALQKSDSTIFTYAASGNEFCLAATRSDLEGTSFKVSQTGVIEEGECDTQISMQSFSTAQCNALTVYTGANPSALVTLYDPRGSGQEYTVGKLADGHCWMLDNLRLGSSSAGLTLTSSDTQVTSDFNLPQLATSGTMNANSPQVYGPLAADTGSGATNYGYLYNWPAATAGETQTSAPAGSASVTHSICPAGWRLPTGNVSGDFAILNAKMNDAGASGPSSNSGAGFYDNWLYAGAFRGVYSGAWWGNYSAQGANSYLWSRTPYESHAGSAYYAFFNASFIDPDIANSRGYALSIRCLTN